MSERGSPERPPVKIHDSPDSDKVGTEWQLVDDSTISQCGSSPRSVSHVESNSELEELLKLAREEDLRDEDSPFQSTYSTVSGSHNAEPFVLEHDTTQSQHSDSISQQQDIDSTSQQQDIDSTQDDVDFASQQQDVDDFRGLEDPELTSKQEDIDATSEPETAGGSQGEERLPTSMMTEPSPLTSSTSEVLSLTASIHSDDSAFGVFSGQSEFSSGASIDNLPSTHTSFVCVPDDESEVQESMHEQPLDEDAGPEEVCEKDLEEAVRQSEVSQDRDAESDCAQTKGSPHKKGDEAGAHFSSDDNSEMSCKKASMSELPSISPQTISLPIKRPVKQPTLASPWNKKGAFAKPASRPTGFTALLSRLWSEIKERLGLAGFLVPEHVRAKFLRLAQKKVDRLGSAAMVNMYLAGGLVSLGALLLWSWARNRSLKTQLLQSQMDLHHHFTTIVNLNEQLSRGLSVPVLQQCGFTSHTKLHSSVFSLSSGVF